MSDFYNFDKISGPGRKCHLWMVMGARRIGKTTAALRLAVQQYLERGTRTVWLRNRRVEIENENFRSNFLNSGIRLGFVPDGWRMDRSGSVVTEEGDEVIRCAALSTYSNERGGEWENYRLMIMDEFVAEDRRYPPHPLTALMSLSQTIFSGADDARIILMSNYISISNPYCVGMKILPPERGVKIFSDRSIAVEICDGYRSAVDDSSWGSLYEAAAYQRYDRPPEDLLQLISPIPSGAQALRIAILTAEGYLIPHTQGGIFYWNLAAAPPAGATVFTTDIARMGEGILSIRLATTWIREILERGVCRATSPNVLWALAAIIWHDL